jgi:hypothetical protein
MRGIKIMSKHFRGIDQYTPEMQILRDEYREWKKYRKDENSPFFIIYKDFQDQHLKKISGGALKLFVFLGFNTNNFTGECWISIAEIADYFENDARTIKNWVSELEEIGLLKRIQTGFKRKANSFLQPYGDGAIQSRKSHDIKP